MVVDATTLLVFIPASIAFNITPGNDMMFCLGQGMRSGPRAGLAAGVGITTGGCVHTLFAALGLATLVQAYPIAFEIVRWAGIAYLLWLAFDIWGKRDEMPTVDRVKNRSAFRAWRAGTIVNLLNPKVIIFMLAFVPQFVDPDRGSTVMQFLVLGAIINLGGLIVNGGVGALGGTVGTFILSRPNLVRLFNSLTAFVFVALAARIAMERR